MSRREVPLAPLAEAFKRSGLTAPQVAQRLGWVRPDRSGRADGSRVMRALGLSPVQCGHGYGSRCAETTSYERAVSLAIAIDLDPVIVDSWLPEPEPEPAGPAADGRCPECGTTATWTDSWDQERCDQCWAIVRTASEAAA